MTPAKPAIMPTVFYRDPIAARIPDEPSEQFYGARTYRALDPERHVWNFRQWSREVPDAEQEAATGLKFRSSLED